MEQHDMKLSERLKIVAEYLPKGARFADIGSDHAYLPCYVCLGDGTSTAIAGEVNQGPYNSAKNNVLRFGLEERIEVRLANGLEAIHDREEVEQVVIAGMGGALITMILERGKAKLQHVQRIIAQPNIDARQVRIWLHNEGFQLSAERILDEKGHIYEILVADRNSESPYKQEMTKKQFLFGPFLMENKCRIFYQKWYHERKKLKAVIDQMKEAASPNHEKINTFLMELQWIEEELADDKQPR